MNGVSSGHAHTSGRERQMKEVIASSNEVKALGELVTTLTEETSQEAKSLIQEMGELSDRMKAKIELARNLQNDGGDIESFDFTLREAEADERAEMARNNLVQGKLPVLPIVDVPAIVTAAVVVILTLATASCAHAAASALM